MVLGNVEVGLNNIEVLYPICLLLENEQFNSSGA